jgi:phage baseplate assembly protein W
MTPSVPLGWPLLPLPDENGQLTWPTLEQSVSQSIRVLLLTRPGEQLMRPGFGGGLEDFLHEPNTLATHRALRDRITSTLGRWEKRILVDNVAVTPATDDPTRVRVEIAYRLRLTGAVRRTGLTLDLGA